MFETTLLFDSRGAYRSSGTRSYPVFTLNEDITFSGYYVNEICFPYTFHNLREDVKFQIATYDGSIFSYSTEYTIQKGTYSDYDLIEKLNQLLVATSISVQNAGYRFHIGNGNAIRFQLYNDSSVPYDDAVTKGDEYYLRIVYDNSVDPIGIFDFLTFFGITVPTSPFTSSHGLLALLKPSSTTTSTLLTNQYVDLGRIKRTNNPYNTVRAGYTDFVTLNMLTVPYIHLVSNISQGNVSQHQFKYSIISSDETSNVIANIHIPLTPSVINIWTNNQTVDYSKSIHQINCPNNLTFSFWSFDVDGKRRLIDFNGSSFTVKIQLFKLYNN